MKIGDNMKKEIRELMDTDIRFCELSQKVGKDGWDKFLSKKAIMGTGKHEAYIEGKNKIVSLIAIVYALEDIDFKWEPVHAFISDDSSLGVTTGTYKRTYKIEEEEYTEIGKYMTTWKKEDGEWKIVFDMGN